MRLDEVFRVLDALAESGIPAWLEGGWCMDSSGSSSRASCTSRIALSRNSGGYFLGAGMILILSGNQTLHQIRGGSK